MAGEPHGAVGVIVMHRAARSVDRKLFGIDADAIAVRVRIGEDARLQHLVRRMADAGYDIGGRQRGLLDLGEIVFRIPVQLENAYLDQRIIRMRPYLGEIERVVPVLAAIPLRHDLYGEFPLPEIPFLYRL